ncbi:hypothetical protein [Paenibacillus cookii]|uniref:Uncharacterized protein n=1 Tax=Paenibacillus cookii TaxID=157839 RepID=A0ABQ4LQD6_9BACL|nr:hypothetical protein [Paenibacillus cookii]KHF36696.1 hypothetical protein CM49_01002 [Paenibacillus sp. P1XP2]GIO65465.1 hypothetical protein J21TS3_02860 [Paenibacillus cookii]
MKKRRFCRGFAVWLCICLGLTGCGMFQNQKSPEAWFKQTLGGLAGIDSFKFSGEAAVRTQSEKGFRESLAYEGILTEHDKLTIRSMLPAQAAGKNASNAMRTSSYHAAESGFRRQDGHWVHLFSEGSAALGTSLARFNPLAQLDAIDKLPKQIREASGAARGTKVLRIELTPPAAKQWLAEQLETEMDAVRKQAEESGQGLSAKEKRRLTDVWNKGNGQMKQMLEHAEVEMVYYLTIDKRTGFPVKLSSESDIRYLNLHHREEHEQMVNDVAFHP